jgi:hypothetical protein
MRYIVIDHKGNQRESFDSQIELLDELREIRDDEPSALETLYVLVLHDGREVGPARRADEILAVDEVDGPRCGFLFDFVTAAVVPLAAAAREADETVATPQRPDGLLAGTR